MSKQICRWGILGTATIARKNWQAIRNSGNGVLVAVASRDVARAEAYVQERQQECPFSEPPHGTTYEELLARDDIDAVYVPLPTGLRREWIIKAAQAGKHILSEKPCARNAAELREMLQACRENNVQFMDGVMFMHSQRLPEIRRVLDDPSQIGTIRRMSSHFSFLAEEDFLKNDIRAKSGLEPHGSLGDLGWYSIRMALWTMNGQLPVEVTARTLTEQANPDGGPGVPLELTAELRFPNNVSAGFYCSFLCDQQQTFTISGTKGALVMNDFVLPFFGNEVGFDLVKNDFQISGCQFDMVHTERRVTLPENSNNHPTSQETNMVRNFANLVLRGEVAPAWGEIALKTQIVLDACSESARNGGQMIVLE
ncbi:MAG TPA: Gfo/Idh/MocA family oxidoreductase [Planctomicrobium sp.]|nr:Gfo/Idh/MocA family oxidoreductase [Planctomicrobium sp.]